MLSQNSLMNDSAELHSVPTKRYLIKARFTKTFNILLCFAMTKLQIIPHHSPKVDSRSMMLVSNSTVLGLKASESFLEFISSNNKLKAAVPIS